MAALGSIAWWNEVHFKSVPHISQLAARGVCIKSACPDCMTCIVYLSSGVLNIAKMDRLAQSIISVKTNTEADNLMFFMVGRDWTFSPRLYQQAAFDFPMSMHWTLTGVGNVSVDHQLIYYEDQQPTSSTTPSSSIARQPLASCVFRLVHVDPVTRKPAPIPEYLLFGFKENVVADGERFPTIRAPSVLPKNSYKCQLRVRYDDMDVLQHTNVSSYLVFAMECASMAAKDGFYSLICDDVAFYRSRRATSIFISECRAGDELEVVTWEDQHNRMLLNFAVCKQGEIINFAQIEYYENDEMLQSQL